MTAIYLQGMTMIPEILVFTHEGFITFTVLLYTSVAAQYNLHKSTYLNNVEVRLGERPGAHWQVQLWGAIGAVFKSWSSSRAKTYRELHDIPESGGTAVTVQAMVFGNFQVQTVLLAWPLQETHQAVTITSMASFCSMHRVKMLLRESELQPS